MADYEVREFREEDEESLLETFNVVFAHDQEGPPPRTREQWRWSFLRNPAGRRIYVALHEGRVVAQYAGIPCRMQFQGRDATFVEIVDSMVHPEHRQGLKRKGLFIRTAEPFVARYGRPDRDLVFYGWPVEKAWTISRRLLGYRELRTEVVLARETGPGERVLPAGVAPIERFGPEAEPLYRRCAASWAVSAVRDDLFLNWRYVENPFHRYTCLGVRRGAGELAGYAVYRPPAHGQPALLVDLLVPEDDPETGRLLERAVLAHARAEGAPSVATLQLEWTPWFGRFQEWGWLCWPTDWLMVMGLFHPRADPVWLRWNWWYQMGDLDVV